ncbi:lamin tail domain-containing protein [bacterium]|nr:lamin tail domain-containing protein [bacterium]
MRSSIHLIHLLHNRWCHLLSVSLVLFFVVNPDRGMAQLRINELMALNQTVLTDEDGSFSDWIEIYNASADPVDLNGWCLTDDNSDPEKWSFPQMILNADGYLIVFASSKNRRNTDHELHTNFKLSGDGEYLALSDPQGHIVSEFNPAFPAQYTDVSYGFFDGETMYLSEPTPGAANVYAEHQLLPPPEFSVKHGFYESPFTLRLTTDQLNTTVYYTTDGSDPNESNGNMYTTPVQISTTTVLRAVAVKSNGSSSITVTQTYLFLDDVIHQPNDPPGYPAEWGPYTAMPGIAPADYEMDPEITQHPDYKDSMKDALLSIPTISIVTDIGNLFSHSEDPDSGGIYIYTGPPITDEIDGLGDGWERPASVEYFTADGSGEFQVNCGVRLQGGHSRRPEKSPKHSFRLVFRSEYGPGRLEYPLFGEEGASSFNTVTLRAGFCNKWFHHSASERERTQYLRDRWAKDTQLAMGHLSGRGFFAHLYINGLYWGLYNPTERLDKSFAASYFGGDESEYDVIKDYTSVVDGEIDAWNAMIQMARSGLENNATYQRIQGKNPDGSRNFNYEPYLDVVNLTDYMILNLYGGNTDWDHHNWAAIRNRVNPDKGFKFFSWDGEHVLKDVNGNVFFTNNRNCPTELFHRLMENDEFCRLFADRVQLHCFNGGVLTPESARDRYMERAGEIDLAVIAESARWGDYRRDVHQNQPQGPFDLYTKNDHWLPQQYFLVNYYFPNRTGNFVEQARNARLYPAVNAPVFYINGEQTTDNLIQQGDVLTMTSANGTIYYTTDGTDPSQSATGTSISESAAAYTGPLTLNKNAYVKARALNGNTWSAQNAMLYTILRDIHDLKITEIHYHPLPDGSVDDRELEFIELKNTGEGALDLGGVRFADGIDYQFPAHTVLNAGGFVVLASNRSEFEKRYQRECFAEYEGNLNNGGERLVLTDAGDDTLVAVAYQDADGWPAKADGEGYSLVPVDLNPGGDQADAGDWRASLHVHGSPGEDDTESSGSGIQDSDRVTAFGLGQNYPNPFNPATVISYRIPEAAFVTLTVYDIRGREVRTLVNEYQDSNSYSKRFDAGSLSSGVYFYRLKADQKVIWTKKMLLMR